MIPIDSPGFWILAIAGTVLTGISKSGFAGGAGVVAVPFLALFVSVPVAAAIMLPLLLLMDIQTVKLYWHSFKLKDVHSIIISAIVGIAIAGFAFSWLTDAQLELTLAGFCLLFSIWQTLIHWFIKIPGATYFWGFISGLSSTLLHAGGPPITIYFLGKRMAKQQWLGQAAIFFGIMNVIKLIPYTLNNLWSENLLIISLILLPIAWCGVKLGHYIQNFLSEAHFVLTCRVLLFLTGIGLLLKLA